MASAPARALLVLLGLTAAAGAVNAAEPTDKLTPQPPLTPIIQTWTVASPRTADGRPPPALIPTPPPRPAPPLSPPSQAVSQTPEAAAPQVIAAPAPAPTPTAVAKAPAAPPPASKTEAAPPKPTAEQKPAAKAPPPPSSKTERVVRYASTEVNVRPRPSQNARRIDILDEGMAVEVIGPLIDDKWAKVSRHGEVLGYVAAEFLRRTPPPPH